MIRLGVVIAALFALACGDTNSTESAVDGGDGGSGFGGAGGSSGSGIAGSGGTGGSSGSENVAGNSGTGAGGIGGSNATVDRIRQTGVDKIDLLFMIDNSVSMADKQEILKAAVPDLVGRLVSPSCV